MGEIFVRNFQNILINDGWEFKLMPNDSGFDAAMDDSDWKSVDIPHDWLIYDTENLYASGEGWYRRTLVVDNTEKLCYGLSFDGIYMDSTIYVNGKKVLRHTNGYTAFFADITDFLHNGENQIAVMVDHRSPNSRWYAGAGIFRDVELSVKKPVHIEYNGVYISANADSGEIAVSVKICGNADSVRYTILDGNGAEVISQDGGAEAVLRLPEFDLWDIDDPKLYTLVTEIICGGEISDRSEDIFGFRKTEFDPDNGFFLNGRSMKLKGVCLHHDLGALGSAVNYRAEERRIRLMKDMGANAVRTAHNMPSRQLIKICNRLGMLVVSECYDMWELEKTQYDNARFFKETAEQDVESWVSRDRNAPCVIMWSIGNEIYDTHASAHGYEIAERLVKAVRQSDPRENAKVTIGSNFIEWENAQKIGEMLGISGYNYTERCYDDHHKKYPSTVIYGSETSSAVRSRGIYHFPLSSPILTHDDKQCSSLSNSCVGWGRPSEDAWIQDRDRKFCAGQFVWTGIDYIGEPTPYDTKNSYFGMADTCCFPKDIYYFYKSVWTDKPMVHLLPYWDFNDGQEIDVIAYTNLPRTELFLNGKSLGVRETDIENGKILHCHWQVPYEKGEIRVKAYDESGNILAEDLRRSFGDPVKVIAKADKNKISADGTDLCFIEISVCDAEGNPVENARNRVSVKVSGAGRLLGMDNGDSTDYEQYKASDRRIFSGKALAIIGSSLEAGEITVEISSKGLEPAVIKINSETAEHSGVSALMRVEHTIPGDDIPIRKIELSGGNISLDENNTSFSADIKIFPENASFDDIKCIIVNENGIKSNIAETAYSDKRITVTAKGDGKGILRVYAFNGGKYPQVISELKLSVTGLGCAVTDPYEFISAGRYDISNIPLNIIENGALGGFPDKIYAGYRNLDLGSFGTDRITLYFGNSTGRDIPVEIWDGIPESEGSILLATAMFPHNNGWGSFSPLDFKLDSRISGIHDICFVISDKCIFGGFEFIPCERAYEKLFPAENDGIYGDDYSVNGQNVEKIGNNVVISFNGMNFGEGSDRITVCGRTPNKINSIQLKCGQKTQILEFSRSESYTEQSFEIEKISGNADISFVFMPGSNFDFAWFRFERSDPAKGDI